MGLSIGSFTIGEIPAPLEYQFLDSNGAALNFTTGGSYTAKFQWGRLVNSTALAGAVTAAAVVTDAANGKVTYSWNGTEFLTPGTYEGMFWVGNGTSRFASIPLTWKTCASVTTPPTI